jgi:hypothetical protein
MGTVGYRPIVDTTYFQRIQPRPARRRVRAAIGIGAVGAVVLLGGCGQDFEQDGGVIPVPGHSSDVLRVATPDANPDAPSVIGPGYAPPRSAGPTQTAVPNIPGGRY